MDIGTIKNEISDFETESIDIVDGLTFNQKDLIQKIIYYYNSKFLSGDSDDQGDKKYFFNINRNPCDVATKMIDFDTKDINIQTASGGTPLKTWFFERDLKFWMRDQNFGKVLNRIFYELPIFGSVVLKVIDGKPYFVVLKNFAVQQDADTLDKSSFITETHTYNPLDFKKIAKEKKWDNWQEVLDENKDEDEIIVYERYGNDYDENDNLIYKRTIIAEGGEGVALADDEIETHPYWEFHLDKISGRWLGIGRIELILDPQVRVNELTNQQAKSSYWSALRLWQTSDVGIRRNLLTDVVNGEILQTQAPINQVDMADRNLTFYQVEINRWLANKDEITFSHEVTRGERLPSGTPLGSAQLAAGMAGAYFDQIQENIALDIKEFLYKVVIPQFEKENTGEHILRLAGEDLDKVNSLIMESRTKNKLFEFLARERKLPNKIQFDLMKSILAEQVKKGKEKLITIPAGFYKDIKYKIEIEITGEALDTRVRAANLFAALQAVTADPTLLTDPTKRKFFASWLEQGKLSLIDFESEVAPPTIGEIVGRAGGGVSRPAMSAIPVAGAVETRL